MDADLLTSLKNLTPDEAKELVLLDQFIQKHANVYQLNDGSY